MSGNARILNLDAYPSMVSTLGETRSQDDQSLSLMPEQIQVQFEHLVTKQKNEFEGMERNDYKIVRRTPLLTPFLALRIPK
jgi:hypothetical protein